MIILYKLRPLYCNIKTEAVNRGDTKDSVVGRDSFYYGKEGSAMCKNNFPLSQRLHLWLISLPIP